MNIKNLAIISALSLAAHASDRKACLILSPEGNLKGGDKVRFVDDDGHKHTLKLVDLDEGDGSILLDQRARAGITDNQEVIIETDAGKLVSLGIVDSVCTRRVGTKIALK